MKKKHKHEWREFANKWHSWRDYVSFYCIWCLKINHIKEELIEDSID